jgi:hypothetical protein
LQSTIPNVTLESEQAISEQQKKSEQT